MKKLSIVVPCLNEEQSLPIFYDRLLQVCKKIPIICEYWFIDDGSQDNTLKIIQGFQNTNNSVHYISFSRNFGKEAAMYAGFQAITGDYIAVMDADLQDPPSMLLTMFNYLDNDEYDCVGTRRVDRGGEKKIKSFLANQFYHVINKVSDTAIVPGARDYRMMTRRMVNAVLSLKEYSRFSKGIFSWVGFRTKYLPYKNVQRVAGTTDWSLWKLFKYAFDGIINFSEVPLSIATWLGFLSAVLSFIGLIVVVIRHFLSPNASAFGWSSLACIILLVGGLQLMFIGVVGKYVGKIYMQSKQRPMYIIKEVK